MSRPLFDSLDNGWIEVSEVPKLSVANPIEDREMTMASIPQSAGSWNCIRVGEIL